MAERPTTAASLACQTCGFRPDPHLPSAVCERTDCDQPGASWWHDKGGCHWLVCDRHRQVFPHPKDCSCAVPCRSCGHESEQHAGSLYGGTGPRRCGVTGCTCKGAYIGSTPARCKQGASDV